MLLHRVQIQFQSDVMVKAVKFNQHCTETERFSSVAQKLPMKHFMKQMPSTFLLQPIAKFNKSKHQTDFLRLVDSLSQRIGDFKD